MQVRLYDPIERSRSIAKVVNDGDKRRCHKVRVANYYGGISTIDVLGCNLSCAYCWVPDMKKDEARFGEYPFLSPAETVSILTGNALKQGLTKARLSGGEPTLNREHALQTLDQTTRQGYGWVFETNGILVDRNLIMDLQPYHDQLYVYFGLKGVNPQMFSRVTRAVPEAWERQVNALKLLIHAGFTVGVNVMANLMPTEDLRAFFKYIREHVYEYAPAAIDMKRCTLFPHVVKRIRAYGLDLHRPKEVSTEWDAILTDYYSNAKELLERHRLRETNRAFAEPEIVLRSVILLEGMKFLPFRVCVKPCPVVENLNSIPCGVIPEPTYGIGGEAGGNI